MKKLSLLFLILLLFTSGCGAQSFVPGLATNLTSAAGAAVTPLPTTIPSPAVPAGGTVCTGQPNGNLHVRACAGVGCLVETTLHEGTQISTTGELAHLGSADWLELAIPVTGWVNAEYLCMPTSQLQLTNLTKGK